MRSTLLTATLLTLTFGVVGCDDGMKKDDTAPAPAVTPAPTEPGASKGGAMEAPGKGGAMEGPAGAMGGAPPAEKPMVKPAETPAPAPAEEKKDMPK